VSRARNISFHGDWKATSVTIFCRLCAQAACAKKDYMEWHNESKVTSFLLWSLIESKSHVCAAFFDSILTACSHDLRTPNCWFSQAKPSIIVSTLFTQSLFHAQQLLGALNYSHSFPALTIRTARPPPHSNPPTSHGYYELEWKSCKFNNILLCK
jgi:hypothetical protein